MYQNNQVDITALLAAATDITPLTNTLNQWKGTFTTPSLFNYLYLIWDLRQSTSIKLCYDFVSCASMCGPCTLNIYYLNSSTFATASFIYATANMQFISAEGYYSDGIICRYWDEVTPGNWVLGPPSYCS